MKFLTRVFTQFSDDGCTTLAAALAFYTAFALPPLLYLLLTVLTFGMSVVYDTERAEERAQAVLESQAAQMLGNRAATENIHTILEKNEEAKGKWWKTLISFAGIIAGATGVVAALQHALNQVWGVIPDPRTAGILNFFIKRVVSLAMILGLGFVLLVSLVITSVIAGLGHQISTTFGISDVSASVVNYAVQALVVLVVFAAIFKFMPDAIVHWRDVLVGATLTTALFLLGRLAMQVYFTHATPGAQLGAAAASFAVFLMWVYYTAMIVLLGAEATEVYTEMYGRGIKPAKNAVRVVKQIKRPGAPENKAT